MKKLLAAVLLWAGTAYAGDQTVDIPEQYMLGAYPTAPAASSSVEKAQSVDGTGYTVISPIFTGSDGNLSYLRFINRSSSSTVTTITIVGYPTGNNYGTVSVNVPGHAAPQYSISEVLQAKNVAGPTNGDTGFALYLKNSDPSSAFGHVIFNASNTFFEDVSMCTYAPQTDYSVLNSWLFNVHTSRLAAYPSTVFIHNYSSTQQTIQVDVYEARFGGYKGTISLTAAANGTYGLPFSWFEQQANWQPSSTEMHANLNFRSGSGGGPLTAVVGQAIFNQGLSAYINMTTFCAINH
jgi:hypothetical protein